MCGPELRGPREDMEPAERLRGVQVRNERGGEQMRPGSAAARQGGPPALGSTEASANPNNARPAASTPNHSHEPAP